ncbi:restriction endonuclease subunit S [Streptomyces fenghuangensis]
MTATQEIRLKYLYSPSGEANHPDEEVLSVYRDHGVIPKSSRSDNFNKTPENVERYLLVRPGDLVVNRMKAWQGSLGVSEYRGIVSGDYEVLRPVPGSVSGRYMHYALRSRHMVGEYRVRSTGIRPSQWRLYWDQMGDIRIFLPPLEEQERIAAYLDRETARVDTLIAEQKRLVKMLSERRIAAITEAVSGAEISSRKETFSRWHPSLPVSWRLGRVKNIAVQVTDGAHISPDTDGGVYDFVSTRDLNAGVIDFEGSLKTTPETYEFMVRTGCQPRSGDVLFSKDGTVGSTAVVRESRNFVVASSLVIITPDTAQIDSDFLVYVFASKGAKENATSFMRGAGLPRISVANVGRIEVPLPPLDEQRRIVDRLNSEVARIDTLIAESERLIELSLERRSALITAAVTGQIDVRKEAA